MEHDDVQSIARLLEDLRVVAEGRFRFDLGDDPDYLGWTNKGLAFKDWRAALGSLGSKRPPGVEVEILPYAGVREREWGDRGTVTKPMKTEKEAWRLARKLVDGEAAEVVTFIYSDGKRRVVYDKNRWLEKS